MYPDGRCGRPVYFFFQALRFLLQDNEFIGHAFRSHTRLDGIDDAANVLFRPTQFRLEMIMGAIVESRLAIEFTMIFIGELGHQVGVHELVPKSLENVFLQDISPDTEEVVAGSTIASRRAAIVMAIDFGVAASTDIAAEKS